MCDQTSLNSVATSGVLGDNTALQMEKSRHKGTPPRNGPPNSSHNRKYGFERYVELFRLRNAYVLIEIYWFSTIEVWINSLETCKCTSTSTSTSISQGEWPDAGQIMPFRAHKRPWSFLYLPLSSSSRLIIILLIHNWLSDCLVFEKKKNLRLVQNANYFD